MMLSRLDFSAWCMAWPLSQLMSRPRKSIAHHLNTEIDYFALKREICTGVMANTTMCPICDDACQPWKLKDACSMTQASHNCIGHCSLDNWISKLYSCATFSTLCTYKVDIHVWSVFLNCMSQLYLSTVFHTGEVSVWQRIDGLLCHLHVPLGGFLLGRLEALLCWDLSPLGRLWLRPRGGSSMNLNPLKT